MDGSTEARSMWAPSDHHLFCGAVHDDAPGRLDEAARRLSHEELAAARILAADGHDVRSLVDVGRHGRRPDLAVCDTTVEVKSFRPTEERGRPPSDRSVFNKLVDAAGQSRHVVLIGYGSGLTADAVRQGLARYAAAGRREPALDSIRALGDGFDLGWSRRLVVERSREAAGRPAPTLGVGR
jgi:hypothetical protein